MCGGQEQVQLEPLRRPTHMDHKKETAGTGRAEVASEQFKASYCRIRVMVVVLVEVVSKVKKWSGLLGARG